MRYGFSIFLLVSLFANLGHADAKERRAHAEQVTSQMIRDGLITSATSAQVDVADKFTRQPLDKQAKIATLLCQIWELAETESDDDVDTARAGASCDVTRDRANLLGRTLGDDVRWEIWYLREKTRAK